MKIRLVNSIRFKFNKNLSDIIKNYEYLTGCDRLKKISQEAYLSVKDPQNGQHYSKLTDLLSFAAVKKIHQKMLIDPVGKKILEEKPRITDQIYNGLKDLNEGTFGKQYFNFMNGLSFKPSERPITKYVPDLQYAYVMQRYKQIHDFLHVLLRKSISVDEQLMIKWFEMRQLNLPSATLASLVSPFLSSQFKLNEISQAIRIADRAQFIMNIDFQKHFPLPINQVRKKFRFE